MREWRRCCEQLKCSAKCGETDLRSEWCEDLRNFFEMLSPKLGAQFERMKRRSNSGKFHHRWKRKFLAFLLIAICFATFLLMESEYSKIKMKSLISPRLQKPKIAFMFIARNRIPLDIVWDVFFQVIVCLLLLYLGFYFYFYGSDLSYCSCFPLPLLSYFCFISLQ